MAEKKKEEKKEKESVSVRLDTETRRKFKVFCIKNSLFMGSALAFAVRDFMQNYDKKKPGNMSVYYSLNNEQQEKLVEIVKLYWSKGKTEITAEQIMQTFLGSGAEQKINDALELAERAAEML